MPPDWVYDCRNHSANIPEILRRAAVPCITTPVPVGVLVGDSYRLRRAGTPVSFLFFLLLHPLLYCGDPAFLFIIPLFYYLSRLSLL